MRNPDLLTTAQVAQQLGCSLATVNRHVRDGKIRVEVQFPGQKGARLYHPAEVDRFAATMPTEASA
jgi:excisionase family DNA binding protein